VTFVQRVRPTNRWTGATGSAFRIIRDPAKLLGNAVARSTQPLDAPLNQRMFPLDHRGEFARSKLTIREPEKYSADFFVRATRALVAASARDISVEGRRISFTGGMLRFVWSWNILNQIGYGQVDLSETPDSFVVSYYASFRQMLAIVSLLVLFMGASVYLREHTPLAGTLALMAFFWVFLFGVNWAVAMVQFPSLVKSMLWGGDRV
jgi:hypothetical protein